ncbi:polymer-forming cytoskeletal protein [Anaerocolumna sp. AGMB13025]|uniref:bactofilin family protein n=1 Tax=Anaerocolumna sp. AGMB13025 TaxID=3039116 RepID=UPI00241E012A|nr:polymer-forming cytoskeletal protein [Anaerocolumna sp. AGMB13025]WFR59946.1 polymer-forming cytoskeletal protein [Anaerocolumna sp. AGMB13025]
MGFFKEFKDDLSQAVNELLPEEVFDGNAEVNTLEDGAEETVSETTAAEDSADLDDDNVDMDILDAILTREENEEESQEEKTEEENDGDKEPEKEDKSSEPPRFGNDEVTVITKGTVINGNITSEGSLEVMGTIKGDIDCQGKLSVVGLVNGNCMAAEVYVGAKRFEGCITSEGSIKIGLGTVVIGDITGTSGVIAGAVKGDIDVSGSIVIDSSAVIKGNIKAQSIQINNGAVIEGFCSLSYASIDIDNIFE